jgi:hypothetical protein
VLPSDVKAIDFQPKQPPILLPSGTTMAAMEKVAALQNLTGQNEKMLDIFFGRLNNDQRIELSQVATPANVDQAGYICMKHSHKTTESILQKSVRPSILAENPEYSVEHVRDSFRFKAVVYSFADALTFVHGIDKLLFEGGLSQDRVVKLDLQKLLTPKEWGWRFLAFDFRFPNGQLVEVSCLAADPRLDQSTHSTKETKKQIKKPEPSTNTYPILHHQPLSSEPMPPTLEFRVYQCAQAVW